jgi:hypothetical protein
MKAATLDISLINEAIQAFPEGAGWTTLACLDLRSTANHRRRDWKCIQSLNRQAGLYAFLLPRAKFRNRYKFRLHGPAKRRLPFAFSADDLPSATKAHFVAYVGRTSNLLSRFKLHFHATKKTTAAQVRKALIECGFVKNTRQAIDFILQHGLIVFCRVPGNENVANRDIIEVALWAKYRCPFNIKSER